MVAAMLATAAMASGSEPSVPLMPVKFNIPPESLIDALQAYSMQTGVQVMFETASAAGYRSARVEGEFMPEVALRMLLADTDLRIRYSRSSAVTLAPASAPDPDAPPAHPLASVDLALDTLRVNGTVESGDRSRLGDYIGAVQDDIQNALKKVAKTRRGDYRVAVKLWVDPSRTIQRAELEGSTGDRDRDSSIASALQGLVLAHAGLPGVLEVTANASVIGACHAAGLLTANQAAVLGAAHAELLHRALGCTLDLRSRIAPRDEALTMLCASVREVTGALGFTFEE